jgi:pimeloyl-ACP methyl ester carboxylesterase
MNVSSIDENMENVFAGVESPYTFDKPALFIKGGASNYILEEDVPAIKSKFPKAQFIAIDGASHWVHADKPDELCAAFSGFLEKMCEFKP